MEVPRSTEPEIATPEGSRSADASSGDYSSFEQTLHDDGHRHGSHDTVHATVHVLPDQVVPSLRRSPGSPDLHGAYEHHDILEKSAAQTMQYVSDLHEKSATFRELINKATENGTKSPPKIVFREHDGISGGRYDGENRLIEIAPGEGNIEEMKRSLVMELANAASQPHQAAIAKAMHNGKFEQAAKDHNAANPDQKPITGGEAFRDTLEELEYQNAKKAYQSMAEGNQAGLPTEPIYKEMFESSPQGQAPPWGDFGSYWRAQSLFD